MGKRMYQQYRYYGDLGYIEKKNYPNNISQNNLEDGTIFSNGKSGDWYISALRIQAPPGTQFIINEGEHPAIIGLSGTFEVRENFNMIISSLKFTNLPIDIISNQGLYIDTIEIGG